MEQTICPGQFRVNRGKWYTPRGKTTKEATYCEWCVSTNHCVQLEEGYTVNDSLYRCLCDCPIKDSHPCRQPYDCGKHENEVGTCDMGICRSCRLVGSTSSDANKYCPNCSAMHGICETCGINAQGKYPLMAVTKMLSTENGRMFKGDGVIRED